MLESMQKYYNYVTNRKKEIICSWMQELMMFQNNSIYMTGTVILYLVWLFSDTYGNFLLL